MAHTGTGEMFTQEQYERLTPEVKKSIVPLTPEESELLAGMNRKQRREWLRANKKKEMREAIRG